MPTPLQLLQGMIKDQQAAHDKCAEDAKTYKGSSRLLLQNWLSEIKGDLARLAWKVNRFANATQARTLDRAATEGFGIVQALSPAVVTKTDPDTGRQSVVSVDLFPVLRRLRAVYAFLVLQILIEVALLLYTVYLFSAFDPQTALTPVQWQSRADARGEVAALRVTMDRALQSTKLPAAAASPAQPAKTPPAAPAEPAKKAEPQFPAAQPGKAEPPAKEPSPCPPSQCEAQSEVDTTLLRADVEGLMATLDRMHLSDLDRDFAARELEGVLSALNQTTPALPEALRRLSNLEHRFASTANAPPPSPVTLIILGSLLGMVAMTAQMNWKHRNKWDTFSYIPWYFMRIVTAPVFSLSAMALLFQVSFTTDLKEASDISALGLRGASPLLIFGVAIFTGLFSNRVFDWLRARAQAPLAPTTPAPTQPSNAGDNATEESEEEPRRG